MQLSKVILLEVALKPSFTYSRGKLLWAQKSLRSQDFQATRFARGKRRNVFLVLAASQPVGREYGCSHGQAGLAIACVYGGLHEADEALNEEDIAHEDTSLSLQL